jgi:predicted nucleotidyltransferase
VITAADVDRVVDRVTALYDPDRIYLFGSVAKGTATAHSDLDLLVVRRTDQPRGLRGLDVLAAMDAFGFDVDLIFLTPDELVASVADPATIQHRIAAHATVVYERAGASDDPLRR